MGKIKRAFVSAALMGGAAAFVWTNLLNEQAKTSLKNAANNTAGLATHLLEEYMGETNSSSEANKEAARQNQLWVEQQWKQAGY